MKPIHNLDSDSPREAPQHEYFLITISVSGTIAFIIWLLWVLRFGFDFTDEGFYLNWISAPFNYTVSVSQFGFVYHPLYLLVGGDVSLLRQANFLISFSLAWLLAWHFLGLIAKQTGSSLSIQVHTAASAALATSAALSLVFAGLWLPTPSYNSLAFQGLLLAATGLVLTVQDIPKRGLVGWVLLGTGGWLSFMGKPTSAAIMAVLIGVFLVFSLRVRPVPLLVTLATVAILLGLSALAIDGSINQFINRFIEGMRVAQNLGGGHSFERMLRLEELRLQETQKNLLVGLFLLAGVTIIVASLHLKKWSLALSIAALTSLSLGLLAIVQIDTFLSIPRTRRGLSVYAFPAGIASAALLISRLKNLSSIGRPHMLLALIFILFPYAYAFGTGNEYWNPIACAATFVIIAAHIFYIPLAHHPRLNAMLLTGVIGVQVLTALVTYCGTLTPYRQPIPLTQNSMEATIRDKKSSLILSAPHSAYLSSGKRLLSHSGFAPETPMIDLTGQSPGFLYAVGAKSIGLAWTLGGYPGSENLVVQSLAKVPCEQLARAWILTEPNGPRPISKSIVENFGANIERDYRSVGELVSPDGQLQIIYAPQRNQELAEGECIQRREKT